MFKKSNGAVNLDPFARTFHGMSWARSSNDGWTHASHRSTWQREVEETLENRLEILLCLGNDSKLTRTGKSMRFIFSSFPIWFFFLVCEPNLCPPPLLNCAKDTDLVGKNVSGQCCPNWQCGNSFHILKFCNDELMYFDSGERVGFLPFRVQLWKSCHANLWSGKNVYFDCLIVLFKLVSSLLIVLISELLKIHGIFLVILYWCGWK